MLHLGAGGGTLNSLIVLNNFKTNDVTCIDSRGT